MYRSDPNDPKFGNRGLEQSKCPARDSLTASQIRSHNLRFGRHRWTEPTDQTGRESLFPVCNNWSEIVCRSYHQMNTIEEKKEEIRRVVDIFDRKSFTVMLGCIGVGDGFW